MGLILPIEIIIYHVLGLLDPEDVINLVIACNVDVTKEIYNAAFHDKIEYARYDRAMFLDRAQARVYTFGGKPWPKVVGFLNRFYGTQFDLQRRDELGDHVAAMCGDDMLLGVLKTDGRIRLLDKSASAVAGLEEGGIARQMGPFVDLSITYLLAYTLDEKGVFWCMLVRSGTVQRVDKFHWTLEGDKGSKAVAVKGCGPVMACMFEGKGISVVSVPLFAQRLDIVATVIPGTGQGVKDWAVIGYLQIAEIVCLKEDGSVAFFTDRGEENVAQSLDVSKYGPFERVYSFKAFCVLQTRTGVLYREYFTSDNDWITTPIVELEGLDVASYTTAGTRSLALTRQGDVYSWGSSFLNAGSLGFGDDEKTVAVGGRRMERYNQMKVSQPTKLALPGRAYNVYVGEDCSAVLMGGSE